MAVGLLKWVERRYLQPVVIVEGSTEVERGCQRNGLDFIHFLRPFSTDTRSHYAVVGDRVESMLVKNFGVRLTRLECLLELSNSDLLSECQSALCEIANSDFSDEDSFCRASQMLTHLEYRGPQTWPLMLDSNSNTLALLETSFPRWQASFIERLHYMVRSGHIDTFDHPVGVIYGASSNEKGGVDGVIQEFRNQATRVRGMQDAAFNMDGELHEFFMLVHDHSNDQDSNGNRTTLADARKMLASLEETYGVGSCVLIQINGAVSLQKPNSEDSALWVEANPPFLDIASSKSLMSAQGKRVVFRKVCHLIEKQANTPAKKTGYHLSAEDIATVQEGMSHYLGQSLIQDIERRLRALDLSVHERRRTTLGKVAAWFKSNDDVKPRIEVMVPLNGSTPRYLANSLEMQMRRCGDLSLTLRDFAGALNYYKMCITELLQTSAERPYNRALVAGCQEGIGIARLLQGKLELPSPLPWRSGNTFSKVKSGPQQCRLEIALNDFILSNTKTHAIRSAFLLFEFARTQVTPALDRARAVLLHVLHSEVVTDLNLFSAVIHCMVGSTYLFVDPSYPTRITLPGKIPSKYPIRVHSRTYIQHLANAGNYFDRLCLPRMALHCYWKASMMLWSIGCRGDWFKLLKYIILSISKLYFVLGNHVKGVALLDATVIKKIPIYSDRETGFPAFINFWETRKSMLIGMGYPISPHMIVPYILRESFYFEQNYYNKDAVTKQEEKNVGEETADNVWYKMESTLKNYYANNAYKNIPLYDFPRFYRRRHNCIFSPQSIGVSASSTSGSRYDQSVEQWYSTPLYETLWLCFSMQNPVGGVLEVSNLCILYLFKNNLEELRKSDVKKSVLIQPGATEKMSLAFSPAQIGEYFIVGLFWELHHQEGCYYFSTKANSPVFFEHLYTTKELIPSREVKEYIAVVVTTPRPCLTADLYPPLPLDLRDGEYFRTKLIITNHSAYEEALSVTLQRSPESAHLIWIEKFGISENMKNDMPLILVECLEVEKCIGFDIVFRAQHSHSLAALRCTNSIFFLLAYLPKAVSSVPLASPLNDYKTSFRAEIELSPTSTSGSVKTNCSYANAPHSYAIRLHRLLRCVNVQPTMVIHSIVIPPSSSSLSIAAALSIKNITAGGTTYIRSIKALHHPHWVVCGTNAANHLATVCSVNPGSVMNLTIFLQRHQKDYLRSEESNGIGQKNKINLSSSLKETSNEKQTDSLVETQCFSSAVDLITTGTSAWLWQNIDGELANSPMNLYFLQTSFPGSNDVSRARRSKSRDFVFYLDTAKEENENEQRRRRNMFRQAGEGCYSDPSEQYIPMVIAVAWFLDKGPNIPRCSGQIYHLIDPMSFLQLEPIPFGAQSPWSGIPVSQQNLSPTPGSLITSESKKAATASSPVLLKYQEKLCETLIHNSTASMYGFDVVAYYVNAPSYIHTTEAGFNTTWLSFRCLSLSPATLLVKVVAATNHAIALTRVVEGANIVPAPFCSLLFIGKTQFVFLLHPNQLWETLFAAHIIGPGIANCNQFDVSVRPLAFSIGKTFHSPTNTSRPTLNECIHTSVRTHKVPIGSSTSSHNYRCDKKTNGKKANEDLLLEAAQDERIKSNDLLNSTQNGRYGQTSFQKCVSEKHLFTSSLKRNQFWVLGADSQTQIQVYSANPRSSSDAMRDMIFLEKEI